MSPFSLIYYEITTAVDVNNTVFVDKHILITFTNSLLWYEARRKPVSKATCGEAASTSDLIIYFSFRNYEPKASRMCAYSLPINMLWFLGTISRLVIISFSIVKSFHNFAQSTVTAVLGAKFENDMTTEKCVMDKRDFTRFESYWHIMIYLYGVYACTL